MIVSNRKERVFSVKNCQAITMMQLLCKYNLSSFLAQQQNIASLFQGASKVTVLHSSTPLGLKSVVFVPKQNNVSIFRFLKFAFFAFIFQINSNQRLYVGMA